MLKPGVWKILLLLVAFTWGIGFPLTRESLKEIPVFYFLFFRFLVAFLCLLPWHFLKVFSWKGAMTGLGIGVLLGVGYIFQTLGLERTSVTHTAFLTGLYSIFTPLFAFLLFRERVSRQVAYACVCALSGLWLLSGIQDLRMGWGDALVVLCAVCFAFQILSLAKATPHFPLLELTSFQLLGVSLVSLPWALHLETLHVDQITFLSIGSTLFLAIIGSSAAFFIQTGAQRVISANQVALILITEPLWGAFFGAWFYDERLPWDSYLGASLILFAVILAEWKPRATRRLPKTSRA